MTITDLKPPRLLLRSVIALMVIAGFYIFAIAIAGVLFYISYMSFAWIHGLYMAKIGLACIAIGGVVLWSIIPRFDRFLPPGPRLNGEQHPKLFQEIKDIAQKINQAPPKEVYLVHNVNAWVAERGGFMGIGSRRVMGIGVLLLQTLSVSEFRAVLAHEFGHYYGGDTKLSPWIYRTRVAISRTIQSLNEGFIRFVFLSFGKLFLRITHAISRYQEYVADEVAARIVSPCALASGLKKICAADFAYLSFWENEFVSALDTGYLPPYAKGFEYYIQKEKIQEAMAVGVEEELAATIKSPYDTHPQLSERLKALEDIREIGYTDDTPAITMLEDVASLEKELFATLGGDAGKALRVTNWASVGNEVYLPMWNRLTEKYKPVLEGLTLEDVSDLARAPREFTRKIELHDNQQLPVESGYLFSRHILGAAISVRLAQQGWSILAMPGEPVKLTNLENEIEPFKAINDLFEKKLTILDWRLMCQKNGIYEMALVSGK